MLFISMFITYGHSFFDIEFDICVFQSIKGIELKERNAIINYGMFKKE